MSGYGSVAPDAAGINPFSADGSITDDDSDDAGAAPSTHYGNGNGNGNGNGAPAPPAGGWGSGGTRGGSSGGTVAFADHRREAGFDSEAGALLPMHALRRTDSLNSAASSDTGRTITSFSLARRLSELPQRARRSPLALYCLAYVGATTALLVLWPAGAGAGTSTPAHSPAYSPGASSSACLTLTRR